MSFRARRGRSVQMRAPRTTCGGPKTVRSSDDTGRRGWDSPSMSLPSDPFGALKRVGDVRHDKTTRRLLLATAALVAAAVLAVAAPGVIQKFGDALVRALHADPGWVVGGIGFELASFAGYIALFWYVANRATARIGLRASGEIALASTAATRLLPTAGAGGAALTFWSLRRAGQDNGGATRTLLSFLGVLYSVLLGAI